MKRLHLLILRSFIGPFILVFFIVLFILLMQFLWRYIDELVGKGLDASVIAELLLYTSASLVPMALPLAILMSSLMTFGNMGEFYELTAIKASGISLRRVMMPLFFFVTLISIGAFFFGNNVMPFTNLKMRSLLYDVRKQRPEITIQPGSFYNGMQDYSIRVERKDPVTNVMYDLKIYDHTGNKGNTSVIIADSGSMVVTADKRDLIFTLFSGYSYTELQEERANRKNRTFPHRFDRFAEQQIIIELSGFGLERSDESLFKSHYQMMNLSQLEVMEDSIRLEINERESQMQSTLLKGNYFRKRNLISPRKLLLDTMKRMPRPTLNKTFHDDGIRNNPVPDAEKTDVPKVESSEIQKVVRLNDTLFASYYPRLEKYLTLKEQSQIYDDALVYARSARTYVVNSSETLDYKIKLLRRYEIEWQRKYTMAAACLVFLLIGAPLGAIIRKGGLGLPLVISTLGFIFYYIISLTGEKFVRESFLQAYQGMWLTPGLFLVVGIFLTYKATTDSTILNFETYSNFFKKYFNNRPSGVTEIVLKENLPHDPRDVKEDLLLATLATFMESTSDLIIKTNSRTRSGGFLASIIGLQENTELILFERLYKNIIRSIVYSHLMNELPIKNKLMQFPNFRCSLYLDQKWLLYVRLILLFIPPITIIVIVRHYAQLQMLKARLKNIHYYTEELYLIVKNNSSTF